VGEWVAFLDCDDVWPSDNLALFRDAIAACPEAALFFGDYRRFIEDIDDAGPSALEARAFFDANAHYVHEFSSLASGVELFRMRSTHLLKHCCLHYCPISTSAVVLNRNVLLSNDIAFREDWMINEDFHVWMRMLEAGAAVAVRQVAFFYRVSPGSLTSDLVRYFEGMAQSHGEWMQRIWPELDDHERRTYRDKVAGFLHSAAWQHSRNGRISAAVGAQLRSLRVRALWEDILAVVRTFIRAVVWRASSLLRGGSRA
jgi:hypothetical protein